MAPVVVMFFVASMASRAASVRIEESGRPRAPVLRELRTPAAPVRVAFMPVAAVGLALAIVAAGGGSGGFLRWVGLGLGAGLAGLLLAVAWLLSPLVIVLG